MEYELKYDAHLIDLKRKKYTAPSNIILCHTGIYFFLESPPIITITNDYKPLADNIYAQQYSLNSPEYIIAGGRNNVFFKGKLHRIDGPAIEIIKDDKIISYKWFYHGEQYSKEQWFEKLSSEEKLIAIFELHKFDN